MRRSFQRWWRSGVERGKKERKGPYLTKCVLQLLQPRHIAVLGLPVLEDGLPCIHPLDRCRSTEKDPLGFEAADAGVDDDSVESEVSPHFSFLSFGVG